MQSAIGLSSSADSQQHSAVTIAATLTAGSMGLIIFGIQPLIFGSLVADHRLSAEAVGFALTLESLAMAAGSLFGLRMMRHVSPPFVTAIGGMALAVFSLLHLPLAGDFPMVLLRTCSGIAEGVLVAPSLALIAHGARPERLAAIFMAIQTIMQSALSYTLPLQNLVASSANAGFMSLAVLGSVAAALSLLTPRDLIGGSGGHKLALPSPAAILTLIAAAFYLGALVTGWGFLGIILTERGIREDIQGSIFAVSLAVQLPGVFTGAYLAERIRPAWFLVACGISLGVLIAVFGRFGTTLPVIWGCVVLYGAVWTVVQPMFTRDLINIDPTRRAALFLTSYQLTGAALLPLLGTFGVSRLGPSGALVSAMVFAFLVAAAMGASISLRRSSRGVAPARA